MVDASGLDAGDVSAGPEPPGVATDAAAVAEAAGAGGDDAALWPQPTVNARSATASHRIAAGTRTGWPDTGKPANAPAARRQTGRPGDDADTPEPHDPVNWNAHGGVEHVPRRTGGR